ncbi:Uncharacterised protein [Streptococcus suis]|uniref:Uncharacterized protein n=1 Tax=Streptococcus suis TaxID=1307 RepID=A0AB33UBU2_STRSU|nr:hypothetical protein [Streptococcus suis]NQS31197.1 hypothetical protein [Streptococcus suis]CYX35936.1 Uncharacterised protein [Streptococcus suis]
MYKVRNLLTFREWQVDTRDELLSELEVLNARKQALDPVDDLEIIHYSAEGVALASTVLKVPFNGTIDEQLTGFGYEKSKVDPLQFFKGLFGSKKKESEKPSEVLIEEMDKKIPVSSEAVEATPDETSTATLDRILESTSLSPEEKQVIEEEEEHEDITDHVADEHLPEVDKGSQKVESQVIEEEQDEEVLPTQILQSEPILKVTNASDIETLSPTLLQQQYVAQLQGEVDRMDELIGRLQKQKQGHLALLEHIENFNPYQALVD